MFLEVKVPYHQMLTKRYLNTYFFIIGDKAVNTTLSCHFPFAIYINAKSFHVHSCSILKYKSLKGMRLFSIRHKKHFVVICIFK